ncbi:MAG TPA: hypothetical protein VNY51_14940 [Candidatus Dormibacteraeota bacterium]|jgi:hypothetical protein|nr:hypothetical protein [Candidatus Dormibacteraeota bacterium]
MSTKVGNAIENKGFSTALIMRRRSTIGLVTEVRLVISNPNKERNFVTHVEADESAYDPWPSSRAGASDYAYPERACNDGK